MSSLIDDHAVAVAKKATARRVSTWDILSTDYNRCLTRKQKSQINRAAKKLREAEKAQLLSDAQMHATRHKKSLGPNF